MEKTICINGVLKVGDTVLSTPTSDYPCFVGFVTAINPLGSREHDEETENHTDDIWVDFSNFYGAKRREEILKVVRELYDEPEKSWDDICWDIVMAPGELIRLDEDITEGSTFHDRILNAEASASMYAFIESFKCFSEPRDHIYSVTRTVCRNGYVTQKTEYYSAVYAAWETACSYYAELRDQYRYSTAHWEDTSIREKGIFAGRRGTGDYFKICIQKHSIGCEPFRFPDKAG